MESAALAEKLADYADRKGVQGETKTISKNGFYIYEVEAGPKAELTKTLVEPEEPAALMTLVVSAAAFLMFHTLQDSYETL